MQLLLGLALTALPFACFCCLAVYTSIVGKETVVAVAVLCVWPIIIEATKSLNKGKASG
jgi:hypothetical protein